jgi:protoheme IX farnesyltransferase
LPDALAVAALGVYVLVVAGTTAALEDAAAACSTWPTCRLPTTLADTGLIVAWGHRLTAALVAIAVVGAAVIAWRTDTSRRVRAAATAPLALYPAQIAVGALTATGGAPPLLSGVHLVVGMGIFASLIAALAWVFDDVADDTAPVEETPRTAAADDDPTPTPTPETPFGRVRAIASAYLSLTKPRLMWLLCLVAAAGMALAAGPALTLPVVVKTLLGGVLAIGASGTFNHVLERDVDRKMARTQDRPVATYQVPVRNAVVFGLSLAAASIGVFLSVNVLAAVLGVVAILFYSVIYTLVLKPTTVQNTVIGGFAGALPALIGWAAVTNRIGLPALALAGVIFLWTPAHFYNLALAYRDDYARAGFPMMPVVHGDAAARRHILWYLAATFLAAVGLAAITTLGWPYALVTVVFGAVFLAAVVALHREQTRGAALRAFHASNAYLGATLVAVLVDALVV